jgi:hypothetical protein
VPEAPPYPEEGGVVDPSAFFTAVEEQGVIGSPYLERLYHSRDPVWVPGLRATHCTRCGRELSPQNLSGLCRQCYRTTNRGSHS